jgi:2-dehydro-3-deoxyphosphogalactonate aldolase
MTLTLDSALAAMPLVAILRGVTPDEVEAIAEAIVVAGIGVIEVPLNSPDPFTSIRRLARNLEGRALVGAGTVLKMSDVERVADAGGTVIVSPNTDIEVIRASKAHGLLSLPGFFTVSEAFDALEAGADALKLFPAEMASPAGVKAMRAVLPKGTRLLAVGGISPQTIPPYLAAGVDGFGVGSDLYAVGRSAEEVGKRAEALTAAVRAMRA